MRSLVFVFVMGIAACGAAASAETRAPWGTAEAGDRAYDAQKVVYDLTSGDAGYVESVLDRAGYLYEVTGSDPFDSSIVIVIHGDAIPFFATAMLEEHEELMVRAQSLTVGTPIEFRMCQADARMRGFEPGDIHGFVSMVPMADAEIVRLQKKGYAYLR